MLRVYVNYPNSKVSLHTDSTCGYINMAEKTGQRLIMIDPITISEQLQAFIHKNHQFASTPVLNDMWIEVHFEDQEFEWAVIEYICRQLGKYYKPFRSIQVERHC